MNHPHLFRLLFLIVFALSADIRHRWVTSVIYDLPIGRQKGFLGDDAAARALLGGWQLGGIFVAQTGPAFTPGVNRDVLNANS